MYQQHLHRVCCQHTGMQSCTHRPSSIIIFFPWLIFKNTFLTNIKTASNTFAIIIKIIRESFVNVKKSAKRISLIPYILDDAVLVRVKIDNLKF